MKKYWSKYWNHKGKYQKLYDKLYERLVPPEGESNTVSGEIIRIVSRVYYDIHNNGGWNLGCIKDERAKLIRLVPQLSKDAARKFCAVPKKDFLDDTNYLKFLDSFVDFAILYASSLELLEKI